MRVAIDMSSAVTGGGITYLRSLLPRLASEDDLELGPVLVRPDIDAAVELARPFGAVSLSGRYAALSTEWKKAVAAASPDVMFVPTEVSLRRYPVPVVQAIQNPTLDPINVREYPLATRLRKVVYRFLARRSARQASAYIAVSEYARSLGARFLGVPADRIVVARHGAPSPAPVRPRRPIRNFLFVSNLYRYKNVQRLIRALATVESEWSLTVAGAEIDRGYLGELRTLAADVGAADRISFLGGVPTERVEALYEAADCLVWPSYSETFGLPLLEARGHGLPIIAARAASNEEIAGPAALYFDPFDVEELAGILRRATQEGVAVGDLPRSYSWDEQAALHADLFRRVAAERSTP